MRVVTVPISTPAAKLRAALRGQRIDAPGTAAPRRVVVPLSCPAAQLRATLPGGVSRK